jgi:hypothetical protein
MIDGHIALAAARIVVPRHRGDPFKQGRFAGAVFAHDDRDRPLERKLELRAK